MSRKNIFYNGKNTKLSPVACTTSFRKFLNEIADTTMVVRLFFKALANERYRNPKFKPHHIGVREKSGMISFMPANKEQIINADGSWRTEGRQEMKPARFLREFLNPRIVKRIKDHEFALFATKFKACDNEYRFVFEQCPVKMGYTSKTFGRGLGSCMMDKDNVHLFYERFGCTALLCKDLITGQYIARALFWPKVELKDAYGNKSTIQYLDKIYAATPDVIELYYKWCEKNNTCRKTGVENEGIVLKMPNGESRNKCSITARVVSNKHNKKNIPAFIPYMVTMVYSNKSATKLSSVFKNTKKDGLNMSCGNTHGNWSDYSNYLSDERYYLRTKGEIVKINGKNYYKHGQNVIKYRLLDGTEQYDHADNRLKYYYLGGCYYRICDLVSINSNVLRKNDPRIECVNKKWKIRDGAYL